MNLLVNSLKHAIYDLAVARGIKDPNVQSRKNARGEWVVAIILAEPGVPPLRGRQDAAPEGSGQ